MAAPTTTTLVERLRRQITIAIANGDDASAALLEEAANEIEHEGQSFDLRWNADMRAIERWQAAHPGNDLVWPDHADLCVWLLGEIDGVSVSARDVLAERRRQIDAEGFDAAHDDAHGWEILLYAAIAYASEAPSYGEPMRDEIRSKPPVEFPWDKTWWKPKDPRRDMVRGIALGLAALEAFDRVPQAEG